MRWQEDLFPSSTAKARTIIEQDGEHVSERVSIL